MKKIVILISSFILCSLTLLAQIDWLNVERAGGANEEYGIDICTDSEGNAYVIGIFEDKVTIGQTILVSNGGYDIFIAKMDTDCNWLWARKAGGISWDSGQGIGIDSAGNVYITGFFQETASFGAISLTCSGLCNGFVAKLDTDGNWQWAKRIGESIYAVSNGLTTDFTGNIYITGSYRDKVKFGTYLLGNDETLTSFISKIDSDGNWLWAKGTSGPSGIIGRNICTDSVGKIYLTGVFLDLASFGSTVLNSSGRFDIYIAKMDSEGNWIWAESAGGSDDDFCRDISVDLTGKLYLTGTFQNTIDFGSFHLSSSGEEDMFVAKMEENNWL